MLAPDSQRESRDKAREQSECTSAVLKKRERGNSTAPAASLSDERQVGQPCLPACVALLSVCECFWRKLRFQEKTRQTVRRQAFDGRSARAGGKQE